MSNCDLSPAEQRVIFDIGFFTVKGSGYRMIDGLGTWYLTHDAKGKKLSKKKLALMELAIERLRVDGYITIAKDKAKLTTKGYAIYTHFYCKC